ncbi:MAG: sensor histidine kinase, partial [Cyanothece sp. SIO2G6]|nr:sensor histidine kinase [Cyanothece sp. SIO2G6]
CGYTSHDHHRWVSITIADNGPPLSSQEQQQLLTLLSNPLPMDEETSLALSYRIVTEKHDGRLLVRSPLEDRSKVSLDTETPSPNHQTNVAPEHCYLPHGTAFQILLPIG